MPGSKTPLTKDVLSSAIRNKRSLDGHDIVLVAGKPLASTISKHHGASRVAVGVGVALAVIAVFGLVLFVGYMVKYVHSIFFTSSTDKSEDLNLQESHKIYKRTPIGLPRFSLSTVKTQSRNFLIKKLLGRISISYIGNPASVCLSLGTPHAYVVGLPTCQLNMSRR